MKRLNHSLLNVLVALACCFFVFPIAWILLMSLKTPAEAFSLPPTLIFTPIIDR